MSRSKSLGRERSTTVSHTDQHQRRTPSNRAINVERAQKLAEVFGVPDDASTDYPPSQMAGVGLRSVRNRGDANTAGAVPRERLASLAYMLDHDRNSLYDLLSSAAATAAALDPDDSAKDDEDEPRSPIDWPYERPTATTATVATDQTRRRAASMKSSKPRGPRPRPDTPSPRHSTTTSPPTESLTVPPKPAAPDTPMESSTVRSPPSRTTSIFRRPSMPSLRRDTANTFVPPTEWESKAPLTPSVPSPAVASGLARRPSFSASATHLALKGSSSSKDSGAKLRKVAPPPKEKGDKENETERDAKKKRATTLARFFGIGYQDLFAAMLSFPSPGDAPPTPQHSRSMPAPAVEPSATFSPPQRPPKSPRRSRSTRLREAAAAAEDAPPLPNSNGLMSSSSSSASRGRDPAVAPLGKPIVRRGSGMPFADTWRSSEERTSGESGSSGASRSKPPPRMTAVTVVVGGSAHRQANFNESGDGDIMDVLSKLRKL